MDVTCMGFALGFAYMTCTMPVQPAPTGRAPFCRVIQQAGDGKAELPSRKDTTRSARYMNRIAAAYKAACK
jgi:hypothetical protein